jgi:hypothetical protein
MRAVTRYAFLAFLAPDGTRCNELAQCSITDGTMPNDGPCQCGGWTGQACTSDKLFCKSGHCMDSAACKITDGTAPNPGDCGCKGETCNEASGRYCHIGGTSRYAKCEKYPACPKEKQDGVTRLAQPCVCGYDVCGGTNAPKGSFCPDGVRCQKFAQCSITDGTMPNDGPCQCGGWTGQACDPYVNGLYCFGRNCACGGECVEKPACSPECESGWYENEPCTATQNRKCSKCSPECPYASHVESVPCRIRQDRVCALRRCTCANGAGYIGGADCWVAALPVEKCTSCDQGYLLAGDVCVKDLLEASDRGATTTAPEIGDPPANAPSPVLIVHDVCTMATCGACTDEASCRGMNDTFGSCHWERQAKYCTKIEYDKKGNDGTSSSTSMSTSPSLAGTSCTGSLGFDYKCDDGSNPSCASTAHGCCLPYGRCPISCKRRGYSVDDQGHKSCRCFNCTGVNEDGLRPSFNIVPLFVATVVVCILCCILSVCIDQRRKKRKRLRTARNEKAPWKARIATTEYQGYIPAVVPRVQVVPTRMRQAVAPVSATPTSRPPVLTALSMADDGTTGIAIVEGRLVGPPGHVGERSLFS